jgi:hypothetical protein
VLRLSETLHDVMQPGKGVVDREGNEYVKPRSDSLNVTYQTFA